MSILSDALPGARVLDLFAGSGALGLEALSRGAASVDFVDIGPRSIAALKSNIESLGVGDVARVHRADALRFAARLAPLSYDVAFADPPYTIETAATELVRTFRETPFARILAVEHAASTDPGRRPVPAVRRHDHYLLLRPMTRLAIYPGSFDPPTRGHEDLARRSLALCDRLIVAVATNSSKQPLFSVEERLELLRAAVGGDPRVTFERFDGLLAEFARKAGARLVVRGLRAVSDFEYEFQMALMNRQLYPELETVFLVPSVDITYLSSSLVREVARHGGDVTGLVHPTVAEALRRRFARPRAPAGELTLPPSRFHVHIDPSACCVAGLPRRCHGPVGREEC